MTIPLPGTTITNGTDLQQFWSGLMSDEPFAARTLWLVLLDEWQRVLPVVMPLGGVPDRPTSNDLAPLLAEIAPLRAEVGADSMALAVSRPGSAAMTDADRQWAQVVRQACGHFDWPFYLATRGSVRPFAPDDFV